MMKTPLLTVLCVAGFASSPACDAPPEPGGGARLAIAVAPLSLSGITNVCYDLTVENGLGDVVWSRANICADAYGDGVGGVSYVGTCDAAPGAEVHTVSLTIASISDASGELAADAWRDPGTLSRAATCAPDADTPVDFAVTVMRRASQGFFDIAVELDDIFCSAKVDCVTSGGDPLRLLFDASGARARTVVVGLACTEGVGGTGTVLYRSDLTVDCPDPFVDVALDPSQGPGNVYAAALASAPVYQYAVYRGAEQLTSGAAAIDKRYWNVAIGVDPALLPDGCSLRGTATASSGPLESAQTPPGTAYPVITYDVPLTSGGALSCTTHPLDGADVTTGYTALDAPATFASSWPVGAPTALALSHAPNARTFTASWSAGAGVGSCAVEVEDAAGGWVAVASPASVDCDSDGSDVLVTLPADGWSAGTWSTPRVRLVGAWATLVSSNTLSCTPTAGSATPTPDVDESCDGRWDDVATAAPVTYDHPTASGYYMWDDGGACASYCAYRGSPGCDAVGQENSNGCTKCATVDINTGACTSTIGTCYTASYYTCSGVSAYF